MIVILFQFINKLQKFWTLLNPFHSESKNKELERYLQRILRLSLNFKEVCHDFITESEVTSTKVFLLEVC